MDAWMLQPEEAICAAMDIHLGEWQRYKACWQMTTGATWRARMAGKEVR